MTTRSIAEFHRAVLDELDLQNSVWALEQDETFSAQLCQLAHQRGFEITEQQIQAALLQERQQWLLRWL
jgi:hypothetical protein